MSFDKLVLGVEMLTMKVHGIARATNKAIPEPTDAAIFSTKIPKFFTN
jgi:hypothetical protein